jgi:hypothetical protein
VGGGSVLRDPIFSAVVTHVRWLTGIDVGGGEPLMILAWLLMATFRLLTRRVVRWFLFAFLLSLAFPLLMTVVTL